MSSAASDPTSDADLRARRDLLAGVAVGLQAARIPATFGELEPYLDSFGGLPTGITGLVCAHPVTTARAQVTMVRARRSLPDGPAGLSADRRGWERDRDLDLDYRLDGDGDLCFEVSILEDPDDGLGHSRDTSAARTLTGDEQAAVDTIRLWYGYRDSLRSAPVRAPAPTRERARLRREVAARHAAARTAEVRIAVPAGVVPAERGADLDRDLRRLDAARLCWQFPRDHHARYARRAVVALAGYGPHVGKRGPWLVARADGDTGLSVGVESLIGVNQDHRWTHTPWLWSDVDDVGADIRWQVPTARDAQRFLTLLDEHAVAGALALAGVSVDDDIAALLDGYPTRYLRAQHTDIWVRTLYDQLRRSAPWRFAQAYRAWQGDRRGPVTLFGLTGVNQQRRPVVALDWHREAPRLRMSWTTSNARLPHALWKRPADLEAALLRTE